MDTKVSIVIPAYYEMHNIAEVISEIKHLHPNAEIIVVDDGSTDDTAKVTHKVGATVYSIRIIYW